MYKGDLPTLSLLQTVEATPGRSWPPPPHDPRERMVVESLDGWQIRIFDPAGRWHRYFATRGFLHLQLWQPEAGVSLLTPSRLTNQRYELFPIAHWKFAHTELTVVRSVLKRQYGLILPDESSLQLLTNLYVRSPAVKALRRRS